MGRRWAIIRWLKPWNSHWHAVSAWEMKNTASAGSRRRIVPGASNALRGSVSGDETEAGSSHGTGLARHRPGKALALKRGRQVHFAAGKKTAKELHRNLHKAALTGRLRMMEWGSSFAG